MNKIININLLIIMFTIFFNKAFTPFTNHYMPLIFTTTFLVLILIWSLKNKKKISFNYFLVLYYIFIILLLLSYFYAKDKNATHIIYKESIIVFVICFSLTQYLDSRAKLFKFINYYLLIALTSVFYIFANYNFGKISRIDLLGSPNVIAISFSFAFIFAYIRFRLKRNKKIFFIILFFLIIIIMTGSVKNIVFVLLFLFSNLIINSINSPSKVNKSKLKNLFIISILLFFLLFSITEFTITSNRLEEKYLEIKSFFLGEDISGSTEQSLRMNLLKRSFDYIGKKPLIGHGINNFRYLYKNDTGIYTYSHNTFIEILVGLGFLGFFVYTLIYVISIYKIVKIYLKTKDDVLIIFGISILGFMFVSVLQETYFNLPFHMFLVVIIRYLNLKSMI